MMADAPVRDARCRALANPGTRRIAVADALDVLINGRTLIEMRGRTDQLYARPPAQLTHLSVFMTYQAFRKERLGLIRTKV